MRRQGKGREIGVGATLMLALACLAALILIFGRESRIFRSRYTYSTTVTNSIGLKAGSPVVMGGVQIGTVDEVNLNRDPKSEGITLRLSVDRAFAPRVRGGSLASVGYITLLSGEKFVNISPGDPTLPDLPSGSVIPLDKSETLFETGQNVAENLAAVTSQLREMLATINSGEGLVGRILKSQEPYFGQETIDKVNTTFDRTNRLLGTIEGGEGVVGRLIVDRDYARETLGSVKSAATRLDHVLETVENKEGALGELLKEDGKGQQVLTDLKEASASLKTVAGKLESRTGLIGRLLNDHEYSEAVAADLRGITASLRSILEKLDHGKGTAGALINDPSVYQSLQDIVAGLQKSRLAKGMLRRYAKKGAGTKPPEAPPEPQPPEPAPPKPPQ